jgi:adenosyl cobinamide kinase/adenosyl cobinamide phosphate guanylyltransferase
MAKLVLILGGARSGKSRFAQDLAARLNETGVLFVATAEAGDAEMRERIAMHRGSRPADWETLECPLNVGVTLARSADRHTVVVIDCLTLLVSNILLGVADSNPQRAQGLVEAETASLLAACRKRQGTVIIVSGEVGQGVVPDNTLARAFRDLLGWANQALARESAATYLLVAGFPVEVRSLATSVEAAATALRREET